MDDDIKFEWKSVRTNSYECIPAPGFRCYACKLGYKHWHLGVTVVRGGVWNSQRTSLTAAKAECERFVRMVLNEQESESSRMTTSMPNKF